MNIQITCPNCGYPRLLDAGELTEYYMHVMKDHRDDWPADFLIKCHHCHKVIGIRMVREQDIHVHVTHEIHYTQIFA